MKNIITIIITTIILYSCGKSKHTTSYHYLKVKNTTNHEVLLGLFDNETDTLLSEYFINPNQTGFLDTVVYSISINDGERIELIKGKGFSDPYWNSYLSSTAYIFDNFKISQLQESIVSTDCDTSITEQSYCHFGTIKKNIVEIKKDKEFEEFETITYIITEQQYLLSDTI